MTEAQIKAFFSLCDSLEIRKYTPVEIGAAFAQLKNEILIGLKRISDKKSDDGGLEAIDSSIKPISAKDLEKVSSDTKVLYGAYAGTNWITGIALKLGKSILEQRLVTKSFLNKSERNFKSRDEFAKMVGDQIKEACDTLNSDKKSLSIIAVSFGFPQIPKTTKQGRDAMLTAEHLTKSWYIKDGVELLVGKYVLEYLKSIGLGFINRIYFGNDTTAVALDVSAKYLSEKTEDLESLPIGFVMGTGDNGSAVFRGYKNDNLVNLEIGSAVGFGTDQILEEMMKENLVPTKTPIIEYYMGGDYLLARLAISMKLLGKNNFYKALMTYAPGSKITSRLAAREVVAEELSDLLKLRVSSDDLFMLNEVAKRMMNKGGQVAGTMVAAVCDLAGWGKDVHGAIPIEGTVFHQGFGFREMVRRTMKLLLPKNRLVFLQGSGTRGIATEAMIRENKL